jgi:hypothetical protein
VYSHTSHVSPPRRAPDRDWITEARRFYRDILCGREVRSDIDGTSEALWFILGRQCVVVRSGDAITAAISIEVDDPVSVAEKCWDAGYTVCEADPVDGHPRLSVIDPFGRRVELEEPERFRNRHFTRNHCHFKVHT